MITELRIWAKSSKNCQIFTKFMTSMNLWTVMMPFFYFNAKFKSFSNRILKKKSLENIYFWKMLKSPNFWPKVVNFRAQKITELTNSELRNRYWNSITELRNSVSELDALLSTLFSPQQDLLFWQSYQRWFLVPLKINQAFNWPQNNCHQPPEYHQNIGGGKKISRLLWLAIF